MAFIYKCEAYMRLIDDSLTAWKQSQCQQIAIGGLFSRNKVAHKWKAPFRSLSLRECVSWRTQDLLQQSVVLFDLGHVLGARVLLRSAFESVAMLIYLNQMTRRVLDGSLGFHEYSEKTSVLLLGSRDDSTTHKAINIITVLEKCNARYPGIMELYAKLSESAHPNHEGLSIGYSDLDTEKYEITYSNKWAVMYGPRHLDFVELCLTVFHAEYNEEWPDAFESLESWIELNDSQLEATKGEA